MSELTFLPDSLQNSAIRVASGHEVMWPFDDAEAAIEALAAARRVILGLDLRSDGRDVPHERLTGLATEGPWSSFDPSASTTPVEDGRRAAIEAVQRPAIAAGGDGYFWVLITWDDE